MCDYAHENTEKRSMINHRILLKLLNFTSIVERSLRRLMRLSIRMVMFDLVDGVGRGLGNVKYLNLSSLALFDRRF